MNQSEFEQQIKPFWWNEHEASFSVCLYVDEYKVDIFETMYDEGFEGNAYDWANLAETFVKEKMPELDGIVKFDPEGSMFCAYSDNQAALTQFIKAFKAMCDDDEQMLDFLSRTEPD